MAYTNWKISPTTQSKRKHLSRASKFYDVCSNKVNNSMIQLGKSVFIMATKNLINLHQKIETYVFIHGYK